MPRKNRGIVSLKGLLVRKSHRWLGIIAAIQFVIWTGSGLFFALIPIEEIRGAHIVDNPPVFRLAHVNLVSPSSLVRRHPELATVRINQMQIKQRLNTPIYIVQVKGDWLVFNAETGEKLLPLGEVEARLAAADNTRLPIESATWVAAVAAGSEYRGGELPAWKVKLRGEDNANLWIGANSGEATAVRTTTWRIYDFLWSLHIMDYWGRDNFNSWLLKGFAGLGLFTIVSGIILFFLSVRRKIRSITS